MEPGKMYLSFASIGKYFENQTEEVEREGRIKISDDDGSQPVWVYVPVFCVDRPSNKEDFVKWMCDFAEKVWEGENNDSV